MTRKKTKATKERAAHAKPCTEAEGGVAPDGQARKASEHAAPFPIVGIGASAGGLAAFEAFFSGMPSDSDTGMAFVLVQHLAPDHKSILTDLIQRRTSMRVCEVQDGMEVSPDCTYIIPPNRDMALMGGALHLLDPLSPRGQRMPIDYFFRSLAQEQRERALCIVLSGTGSDGTMGMRAIKGEGGMAMAQAPETTEHDGMPRSAIATGLVDFVLAPAEMPARLIAYVAHALDKPGQLDSGVSSGPENELMKIFVLLRDQTGHDFSKYKPSTVQRRIERRMAVQQVEAMDEYVKLLQRSKKELDTLFRNLLIGVTGFFRDQEAFSALQQQVIRQILAAKVGAEPIRVWVPGCSTGEEAYSIAILLAEQQEALNRTFPIQVFATDIDSQAITTARVGVYPAGIAAQVSAERMARFFTMEPDGAAFRLHKTIRDMLVFSEQDVLRDPPFSRLDLISCRNLLIYLGADVQRKLIPLFHFALNPSGFLFLGTSETVGDCEELFSCVDRRHKLFQRKEASLPAVLGPLPQHPVATNVSFRQVVRPTPIAQKLPLREFTERALLQQLAPVAALVAANGDVLYFHGRTGLYLEPPAGEAGVNNVLKMAREGLRYDLATALHRSAATSEVVSCPHLQVKTNGEMVTADLTVCPVPAGSASGTEKPLFLVILQRQKAQERTKTSSADESEGPLPQLSDAEARIAALQHELRAKDDYLQSANEELETANEELNASNEELQSVNEELQSTNEELETSKEELQSVNEELSTVNAALQAKVADLTQANNDMNNLLAGTNIATIFVDQSLCILRFTPTAIQIINLIHSDIGRPVNHIVSNLGGYDGLARDTQRVLDTLVPSEKEVRTTAGKWFNMRIQPYRTLENKIEGAVITFVDISEIKRRELFFQVFHASPVAMTISRRHDGTCVDVNDAFLSLIECDRDEVLGRTIVDLNLIDRSTRDPLLGELAKGSGMHNVEITARTKTGRTLHLLTSWKPIEVSGEFRVVSIMRDITDLKQAQQRLRFQLSELENVYDSVPFGLATLDSELRYVRVNETLARMNGIPAEAHIGKTVEEIVPALGARAREITAAIAQSGEAETNVDFAGETAARPGVERAWMEGWYPIKDDAGKIEGFSVVVNENRSPRGEGGNEDEIEEKK